MSRKHKRILTAFSCSIAAMVIFSSIPLMQCFAQCNSTGVSTPVTVTDESSSIPGSRQFVNGTGTTVNISTPGQISIDASSSSLTYGTYSAGSAFAPLANTFTNVTNATEIDLPGTSSLSAGSVIALTIGGAQGATTIKTNGGANDENIIFNGSTTNNSLTINNGDEIFLMNRGSGTWLVTSFLPQGGSSGSKWTITQGGTGSDSASGARTNLGAAASGANSDITSLSGLTTALSVAQGGTGATTASGARSNISAAASGANSDITSLSGLTTALSVAQGGTGSTTASGARSNLSAAESGANSDITSLSGLTTALSIAQGGTGATTASGARSNLSAAASGANSDITSLSGLTTALSVAQGGTGSTTASGARSNLSAAASGANSDITSLSGLTTALSVGQGGTGATSLTAHGVLIGNGTGGVNVTSTGTAGQVLTSNGSGADPTWQAGGGGGGSNKFTIYAKSSSFTASDGANSYYRVSATATVTMPASPADGSVYKFKVTGGTATFAFNGSETINHADGTSDQSLTLTSSSGVIELIAVSGGWDET